MFHVFEDLRCWSYSRNVERIQLLDVLNNAAELAGEFLLFVVRDLKIGKFGDVFHIGFSDFHR